MDYATKFHQNLDAICIPKALDQDLSRQLSKASFLLSPSLVASHSEYPRVISLQLAFLVKELNKH